MGNSYARSLPKLAGGLFVVLALVLGMLPNAGLRLALADDSVTYPLWIGETQVSSANLEGTGWSFSPASAGTPATLTLDGFSYSGVGHTETQIDKEGDWELYRHAPIFWNSSDGLVIALKGENNVIVMTSPEDTPEPEDEDEPPHRYANVCSVGNLTFQGSGTLNTDTDLKEGREVSSIFVGGGLTVEGGSLNLSSDDMCVEVEDGQFVIGEHAGTIVATSRYTDDTLNYAIYAHSGMRIDGGTVNATGYRGITAGDGLVINGGTVSAQSNVPPTYLGSIMNPSGIVCENGPLTVNGGSVVAKGFQSGITSKYYPPFDDDDEEAAETEAEPAEKPLFNGIVINAGSVVAEASADDGLGISVGGACRGTMTIAGGSVQALATGSKGIGIEANESVEIGKGVTSLVTSGAAGAFGENTLVKNEIGGMAWTNLAGSEGKTALQPQSAGQTLNAYQKAQFPAPVATVVDQPVGLFLIRTGAPQELVLPGTAEGGELQYSLDGSTFSSNLPTATNVGEYTISYKVVGDASHADSAVETTTAIIFDEGLYTVVSGDGSRWTKGSQKGLTLTIKRSDEGENDATFAHFLSAYVDGVKLERDVDYSAAKGSVVLTLAPSYLESLSVGTHTVAALFDDGVATAEFTVSAASSGSSSSSSSSTSTKSSSSSTSTKSSSTPSTGDSAPLTAIAALFLAGAGFVAVSLLRKRREQ